MKICIVGGGISGLSTAYFLKKLNNSLEIDIFEKESVCGGKIKTTAIEDFIFEEGAIGLKPTHTEVQLLVNELNLEVLPDLFDGRLVYDGYGLHKLPETVSQIFYSSLLGILSKIKISFEFISMKNNIDQNQNSKALGIRKFGKQFALKILDPLCAGLFASSASKLSSNVILNNICNIESEKRSILSSILKYEKNDGQIRPLSIVSIKGGLNRIVNTLTQRLDAHIITNTEVVNISSTQSERLEILTACGKQCIYDCIVICTPTYITSRLLKDFDRSLSHQLKQIEYNPVSIVTLGFDKLPDNYDDGILTFTTQDANSNAILLSVTKKNENDVKRIVRVTIGGQRNPFAAIKDEQELTDIAIGAILQILKIDDKPRLTYVTRWHKGIPNYDENHKELARSIFKLANQHKNIYLNSNALSGLSINECIINSKYIAEKIARH